MCTGKARERGLVHLQSAGALAAGWGRGLALPDTGLAEAGLERRVWVGAGAGVAKEPPAGVARPVHSTLPGDR